MAADPAPPRQGTAAEHGHRPLTVVIADNDATVVELLRTDLTLEGHVVVATAEGGEAVAEACARHRPDVLIVDYRMPPGPDGLQIAAAVKAADSAGAVVLYTNYLSSDVASRARGCGAILVSKGPLRMLRETLARLMAARE